MVERCSGVQGTCQTAALSRYRGTTPHNAWFVYGQWHKYWWHEVMKHNSNPKRGRGRSGGRRSNYGPNRTYDSNGPDVKVRGTATQVCDRYLALARDASSSGDRIKAEGYLQHAEHYYRVVHGDDGQQGQSQGQGQGQSRYNGRRSTMVSPAEIALSGEQAPVYHMDTRAEPAPNAEEKDRPGSDVSVAAGEPENGDDKRRDNQPAVVEDTSEAEPTGSEGDAAASA